MRVLDVLPLRGGCRAGLDGQSWDRSGLGRRRDPVGCEIGGCSLVGRDGPGWVRIGVGIGDCS